MVFERTSTRNPNEGDDCCCSWVFGVSMCQ